jgi:hypothetical protein
MAFEAADNVNLSQIAGNDCGDWELIRLLM